MPENNFKKQMESVESVRWVKIEEIENVAIAKALQPEAARATPALSRFNYDAIPSLKSPKLFIAAL